MQLLTFEQFLILSISLTLFLFLFYFFNTKIDQVKVGYTFLIFVSLAKKKTYSINLNHLNSILMQKN